MPEDINRTTGDYPVIVRGNRLATEMKTPGQTFNLSSMVDIQYLGSDRFEQIYFRTNSGNIYRLDCDSRDRARLINANESRKRRQLIGMELPLEEIRRLKLTVGEPFVFGGSSTTKVMDIVAVTGRVRGGGQIQLNSEDKTSTIVDDFRQGLPAIPDLRPGYEGDHEE